MIGLFWNIRGLNKPGKALCVSEILANYKVDFVGLQEIKKENFTDGCLRTIAGSLSLTWFYLPAAGTAGGILLGFKEGLFQILGFTSYKYCASALIKNIKDDVSWQLIVVYGSAYAEFKMEFITELHQVLEISTVPTLIGGDFNLTRSVQEESSGNTNAHWTFLFNDWINRWALIDLKISNRSYTWSNNQGNPVMATLDRILASTDWDALFPLTLIKPLPRIGSDHAPLLLDTGGPTVSGEKKFRFEKGWFSIEGFTAFVEKIWNSPSLSKFGSLNCGC